jgi:hypothetical protein
VKKKREPGDPSTAVRRREVLQGLAGGLAGVVAAPSAAALARESESPQTSPPATGAGGESYPSILDEHGRALLARIAEQLVPGSEAAGAVDLLDRVMAVEPVQEQRRFLNALGAFERESRFRYGRGWLELDEPTRNEILVAASTLASARPVRSPWTKGRPIELEPDEKPPATLRDHFDRLRDLIARAYYATEPGMKELGFTGRLAWTSLPGCAHPGGDHP